MNRRSFLTRCALGSAGLAAFFPGCQSTAQTERAPVAGAGASERPSGARPAIDLAAPSVFESATFALG
ncbi:MAG: twin-arginine translocation signal domain-containing protein [Desulfosarcinaceae bacterium]|jgi:hypothetical protein